MKMLPKSLVPSLIALAGLFSAPLYAQTSASHWSSASARKDLFVQEGSVAKAAPQSILLIGENHASVKAQSQLAELLEILYQNQSVDAILVEGSNGEIKASQLRDRLAKPDDANTKAFWKGQLGLGQIAGYEYVAITEPGVRIQGVENMDAKREYLAGAAERGALKSLQDQVDQNTRALNLARGVLADHPNPDAAAVLSAYEAKITQLSTQIKRTGTVFAVAQKSYTDGVERLTALYAKIQPVLPAYDQAAKQAAQYQKLVEQAKKIQAGHALPPGLDEDKFLIDFKSAQSRMATAQTALEATYQNAGYANLDALQADLAQVVTINKALTVDDRQLKDLAAPFNKLENDLNNQFFLVANAVRAAVGKPVPALQTFLFDEREKARNANDPEKPFLSDRDKFMVANTMAYLKNATPPVHNVVLIIGYAHLDGMKTRLSQQNVSLVAGKIAASEEDIEEWENKAWDRRMRPTVPIFSSAGTKELSRLLDQTYEKEIPALLARLDAIKTNPSAGIALGRTKVFEASNGVTGRKAIITTGADNLKSDWGAHVVQLGTLPDGSGSGYLIVDRDLARSRVKANTKGHTAYATLYRTKTAKGLATNLDTATGTVSLAEFKASAPRVGQNTAKRVVIAAEGDEDVLNAALASGGSGSGKPPWTSRQTLFAEPPDNNRPSIFFTKNIDAASERLAAIEKQDPLKIGDIAVIKVGLGGADGSDGLNDLWFTPETGEHARAYFIIGDNTPEFRQRLKQAGQAGLLRNKQIALGTCFDQKETNALNDMLLEYGALMVWSPSKRVSPDAATKLASYMQKVDGGAERVQGMDEYIDRSLRLWHQDTGGDPDLDQFVDSVNRALLDLVRKITMARS